VYVQPFPPGAGKYQISKGGGVYPSWRADGKELFFWASDGALMATAIDTSGTFSSDLPRALFSIGSTSVASRPYAAAKDGKRFLIAVPGSPSTTSVLTVMLNWTSLIPK
jgi:eukaryotic-like serine/threonine-protein kinase